MAEKREENQNGMMEKVLAFHMEHIVPTIFSLFAIGGSTFLFCMGNVGFEDIIQFITHWLFSFLLVTLSLFLMHFIVRAVIDPVASNRQSAIPAVIILYLLYNRFYDDYK